MDDTGLFAWAATGADGKGTPEHLWDWNAPAMIVGGLVACGLAYSWFRRRSN